MEIKVIIGGVMKKILIFMMIFTLSFGVIGCGKNRDDKENVNKKNETLVKEDNLPESEKEQEKEEVEIEKKEEKTKRYSLYDKEEKNTREENEINKNDNKSNKKIDNYDKTLEKIKKEMKESTWERVFDDSNGWILLDNNLNPNSGEHRIKLKLRREKPMILVTAIIPFEDLKNNKVDIKLAGTKFNEYGNMLFEDKLDFTELDK